MSNPPPEWDDNLRTHTQRLADDIATACTSLRRNWPFMIKPLDTQPPGAIGRAGVTLNDHDKSDADTNRITRTLSLRRLAQDQLRSWSQAVIEDRGITSDAVPEGHDVPGMAEFLARHADWLSGQDYGPDCRDELRDLSGRCANIAFPKKRESMSIGRCPLEILGDMDVLEACHGDVRYRLAPAERPGEAQATCSRCGQEAVFTWWAERMYLDGETSPLVTAAELIGVIAYSLKMTVTHVQIRQWKRRGKIAEAGKDDKGRTLFAHAEVIDALRADLRKSAAREDAS